MQCAPTTGYLVTTIVPATEEFARSRDALGSAGCDFALLSSLANVTYVTGTEVPVPVGAGAELTYGPWLALVSAKGSEGWFVVPAGGGGLGRGGAAGFGRLALGMLVVKVRPGDAR